MRTHQDNANRSEDKKKDAIHIEEVQLQTRMPLDVSTAVLPRSLGAPGQLVRSGLPTVESYRALPADIVTESSIDPIRREFCFEPTAFEDSTAEQLMEPSPVGKPKGQPEADAQGGNEGSWADFMRNNLHRRRVHVRKANPTEGESQDGKPQGSNPPTDIIEMHLNPDGLSPHLQVDINVERAAESKDV